MLSAANKRKNAPPIISASSLAKRNKSDTTKFKNRIICQAVELLLNDRKRTGGPVRGDIKSVIDKVNMKDVVNADSIYYRLEQYNKGVPLNFYDIPKEVVHVDTDESSLSSITNVPAPSTTKSRKMSAKEKENQSNLISQLKTMAAYQLKAEQVIAKEKNKNVPDNTLKNIIQTLETDNNIPAGTIKAPTILYRARTNNLIGHNPRNVSPLIQLEGFLAAICKKKAEMGMSMNKSQCCNLMGEWMMNTPHEEAYRHHLKLSNDAPLIPGNTWYRNFLKRNRDTIITKRSKIYDNKRKTYCTQENFDRMYANVYEAMVACGVAKKLDCKVMLDREGNQVDDEDQMFGLPTEYILTHPECVLFMDETGSNTNQKADNLVGGERQIVGRNSSHAACVGVTTDIHFTVCCFTSGTGFPVMCAVIFKSNRAGDEIPVGWKTGIDRTMIDLTGGSVSQIIAEQIRQGDMIPTAAGGTAMGGGPSCQFNNRTIPCFYAATPNASISSDILVSMLATIDNAVQYDRSNGKFPCLIVDGHPSRCNVDFLTYVNRNSRWKVCVGVPYGTHIWQVADSSELNGSFKIAMVKAKREYRQKAKGGELDSFSPYDIIPLINKAWNASFAKEEHGKKAICERGWGPLNYNCLLHPNLQNSDSSTITINENGDSSSSNSNTITTNDSINHSFSVVSNANVSGLVTLQFNSGERMQTIVESMIGHLAKDEGMKKQYEKKKAAHADFNEKYKVLQTMTRVSTGKLTSNDIFVLDENVLQKVLENNQLVEATLVAKDNRKLQKMDADKMKLREALDAFHLNPNKLVSRHYKTLITATLIGNESPAANNRKDLEAQFANRKIADRLQSCAFDFGNNDDLENIPPMNNNNNNEAESVSENFI